VQELIPVIMANAQSTSAGVCVPDEVVTLPAAGARDLIRAGLARRVPAGTDESWVSADAG
jgi:hypothetical protein